MTTYMTVVYDVDGLTLNEIEELTTNPRARAMAWGHKLDELRSTIDYQSEAADARMDSIMRLEHLKVAIEVLEKVASEYVIMPPFLQANLAELKKTARDYDHKLKGDLQNEQN